MTTSFNPLNHPAIFATPVRWTQAETGRQHLPFLFYLVSALRPRMLVETGTTTGAVYCGFCQIVAAEKLPTRCLAFPAQARQLAALRAYHDPLYGGFSQLLTQPSAAGLEQLADGSIDLLHVANGLADLPHWLPKLSPRGLLVISALNSLSEEAGQVWSQVKAQYPHFTFMHDGGLEMLVVGAAAAPELLELSRLSETEADKVRTFFYQLGQRCFPSTPETPAAETANELTRLRTALAGREKQLERLQTQLTQRKRQLHDLTEKYTEAVNSDAWWMFSQYWVWRCRFFPVGSHRERGLKSLTRGLRILRQFGVMGTLKKVRGRVQRRLKIELVYRQDSFNTVSLPASWQPEEQAQIQAAATPPQQKVDEYTLKLVHTRPPIAIPELELPEIETAPERAPQLPNASVSVVIPTWNAGDEFALLLSSLAAQQGCDHVEIIIVDSGSTDGTVKLARDYGAHVLEISQAEFSHSHARNLGAQAATCEYLLFMVQDALPASNLWLHEMIAAAQRLNVVAATCIESPREDADLLARLLGKLHNEYLGAAEADRVFEQPASISYDDIRRNCQLNNVACLIERQVFDRYGFQGAYAEDLDLGMRLGQDGQRMAVLNTVKVVHSHNRPAYYHLKRGYVDCTMMAELFADYPEPSPVELGKLGREAWASFQSLEAVLAQFRDKATFPLPLDTLSAWLIKHIEQAYKNPADGLAYPVEPTRDAYTQFLTKLAALSPDTGQVQLGSSSFALGVSGMLINLFDYLEGIYEIADTGLLASIGEFLQKIHALQLGSYLASSANAGRAEAGVVEWIETELRKGV